MFCDIIAIMTQKAHMAQTIFFSFYHRGLHMEGLFNFLRLKKIFLAFPFSNVKSIKHIPKIIKNSEPIRSIGQ